MHSKLGRTTFLLLVLFAAPNSDLHWGRQSGDDDNVLQAVNLEKVDRTTLVGKVMCGYQGWFNCEGDGADLGWTHWTRDRHRPFAPGNVTVDLWPDMSEYDDDEKFATGFRLADGSAAKVFSSNNRKTVLRHFQWMQEYGIDGAFVQRFPVQLQQKNSLDHNNRVLRHARDGASEFGRAFAVMYDLSGLEGGEVNQIRDDWTSLNNELQITNSDAYLHHENKPVVAIWGIGFHDREYSLQQSLELIKWLKLQDCTVMLGVPSFWRESRRDALDDPLLLEIISLADVVSPWSVGRYRNPEQVTQHASEIWQGDKRWCDTREIDFLPVIFPGFSWHNLKGEQLDAIPRLKGQFLWSQIAAAKRTGCEMIYIAMFDEVDEATSIFKCTNDPPVGDGATFLTYEGLPSDHYLKIAGQAGKLLRNEIELTDQLPSLPDSPSKKELGKKR